MSCKNVMIALLFTGILIRLLVVFSTSVLACGCNSLGTVNNTIQCDQYTGACPCKTSVKGRYCDECKDGFYFFPITEGSDCLQCPCDLGGAFPQCDRLSGERTLIFYLHVVGDKHKLARPDLPEQG